METNYHLRFLRSFQDDLDGIAKYIKYQLNNPQAAESFLKDVDMAISKRLSNPDAFEPTNSAKERRYPYYRIYVKNYVIYYVVITENDEKIMEVRRIIYGRRNR